jgi:hypothetical protein
LKPELHRGLIAKPPKILSVRVLTREDMALLKTNERVKPRVKAFRETHHRLARLIAAGLRTEEISHITGYSPQRITTLRSGPAFQNLIEEYRPQATANDFRRANEMSETLMSNAMRMERMVEDHLDEADDNGELLPLKTLFAGISDRLDRLGYARKTVSTNITIDYARKMEELMAARGQGSVIDSSPARLLESTPREVIGATEGPPVEIKSDAVSAGVRRRV